MTVMNRPVTTNTPERSRPSREEILVLLRRKLPELEARFGVRSMGLFGSYATGEATEQSDVDILVDVDPSIGLGFVTLAEVIEDELGLPVDLVSVRAIKPRYREAVEQDIVYV
ncbi:MAG: nucleotidyltransferase family protein [Thermoleophilia bacterium]